MNYNSSGPCYIIEACVSVDAVYADFYFTKEWKSISALIQKKLISGRLRGDDYEKHGFFSYHQAKALEHWLHSSAEYRLIGLKTRLVQYAFEINFSAEVKRELEPTIGNEYPEFKR